MKNLESLEKYRSKIHEEVIYDGCNGDNGNGFFLVPSPVDRVKLVVIASDGDGWDHVSVSRKTRTPNWKEMSFIKELFFNDDETVMQLHVPIKDHINMCKTALHLWRPHNYVIPTPPKYMV